MDGLQLRDDTAQHLKVIRTIARVVVRVMGLLRDLIQQHSISTRLASALGVVGFRVGVRVVGLGLAWQPGS